MSGWWPEQTLDRDLYYTICMASQVRKHSTAAARPCSRLPLGTLHVPQQRERTLKSLHRYDARDGSLGWWRPVAATSKWGKSGSMGH